MNDLYMYVGITLVWGVGVAIALFLVAYILININHVFSWIGTLEWFILINSSLAILRCQRQRNVLRRSLKKGRITDDEYHFLYDKNREAEKILSGIYHQYKRYTKGVDNE